MLILSLTVLNAYRLRPFTLRRTNIWTQPANWWLLNRVQQSNLLYHYSTKAVNLGSMSHGFTYRTPCRTLFFSVKYPGCPEYLSRVSCQHPSHLSHHWIILMATKAGHSSSFSTEAYDVGVCWEWWICTHRSFRRSTTLTMLPICLHLDYSSSPLVTLKKS